MKIDVHVYTCPDLETGALLAQIARSVAHLVTEIRKMATKDDLDAAEARTNAALERINTAVANVAADVRALVEMLPTSGGLDQAGVDALASALNETAAKAEAVATAAETAASISTAGDPPPPPPAPGA